MSITRVTCPKCKTVQFQITNSQTVDFDIVCVSCSYIGDFTAGRLRQENQDASGHNQILEDMPRKGREKTDHQYQASDGFFKRSGGSMRDFVKNKFSQYNPLKVHFSKSEISEEAREEIKSIAKKKAKRRKVRTKKVRGSFKISGNWVIILVASVTIPILFFISQHTSLEKNNFVIKSLHTEALKLDPKKLSFKEEEEGFFSRFFARYEYQLIKKEISSSEMFLTVKVRSKHNNKREPNIFINLYDFKGKLIKKYKYPVGKVIPKEQFTEVSIHIYNQPFNTAKVKVKVK